MNCPKCGLQKFFGIGGYAGPQCMCEVTMPMTPNNANELAELEQQLAEREKQIVELRTALKTVKENPYFSDLCAEAQYAVEEALDATKDLSGLVVCYAVPVAKWYGAGWSEIPEGTLLYEARKP